MRRVRACDLRRIAEQRPYELRDAWQELQGRGPKWRQLVAEALTMLEQSVRDRFEQVVGPVGPP